MRKCGAKLLWLAILLMLLAAMGVLLIGGDILLYLAPRMVPMVWFGFAVIAVLSVYLGIDLVRCLYRRQGTANLRMGAALFLVPVILLMTVAPDTSTPGSLANQNVQMIGLNGENDPEAAQTEETNGVGKPDGIFALPACVLLDEYAPFDPFSDLFSSYLRETAEELTGRTITVYGFVYTDDTFPEQTVLVARLLLNCCAADASIVGFHVKVEAGSGLRENGWIRVTGTVRTAAIEYYGNLYDLPVITDGIIVRCDAPDAQGAYIYP